MTKQTRVAFYARYSDPDKQTEASIEDQFRNLTRRAEQEGWKIVAKFADKGITGQRNDRPQYQRMLAAARRQEFDVLLIEALDRFARNLVEQEQAIRRMEFDGIRIVGIADGYDSLQKGRKLTRAMRGAINEGYSEDLAEKTHRGQTGQALKGFLAGGRPYGYVLSPVLDGTKRDQFGNRVRIGTLLKPQEAQAKVVLEIFRRFADGESERGIAGKLNARHVPSPGSSWDREVRRANGWQGSAIRAMLYNETYNGRQVWNKSRWVRDPDTRKRVRQERPKSEWLVREDETLRVVPPDLWARVEKRLKIRAKTHSGGSGPKHKSAPRYVLSGLLRCGVCGSHYVICSKQAYACSSFIGGGSKKGEGCKNNYRINRKQAEKIILDEMRAKLLAPDVVKQMAKELEQEYEARLQARANTAAAVPKELEALDERIARLRARLTSGDPDLAPDELQAAIERAEQKRLELLHAAQPAKARAASAKVYAALPNAARLYERQILKGLDGSPEEAAKARMIIRELVGGKIELKPTAKGLVARSALHKDVLVRECMPSGSGGRI